MAEIVSNQPFRNTHDGRRSMAIKAAAGTAQLQKLAGTDPGTVANFIDVTDGLLSADGEFTFYAPQDQYFRIVLTGDASGNLSQ